MNITENDLNRAGVTLQRDGNNPHAWIIWWYRGERSWLTDRIVLSADNSTAYVTIYDRNGEAHLSEGRRIFNLQGSDEPLIQAVWYAFSFALEDEDERREWQTVAPGRMRELAASLYGFGPDDLPSDIA